jgi:phosphohistidine phosphatase SixA
MRCSRVLLTSVVAFCSACGPTPTLPTPDTRAPGAPTKQAATVMSDGAVSLTWKNAADSDLARTLVARFQPSGRARQPEGTPAVGDVIGTDGTVIFVGRAESFVDLRAPNTCGSVSYRLWSQDTQGLWSEDFALIELTSGATSPAPSQPVTLLTAAPAGPTTLLVSWVNPPSSSGFFQTTLVRKVGLAPTSLTDGDTVLTSAGGQYSETLRALMPGTRLFYGAFTCNACGRCQAMPAVVSFTVPLNTDGGAADAGAWVDAGIPKLDGGSPGPSSLSATLSADGQRVLLAWLNPDAGTFDRVRITRSSTENGPDGGFTTSTVQVFEGTTSSASELVDGLLPFRTYTYLAVGCSTTRCETAGITASLTLTLKQALRGGGYTIFWRHASADVCSDRTTLCPAAPGGQTCGQALAGTANDNWWKTCVADPPTCATSARQLNVVNSSNETMAVRTWFQMNGVTVGRILTSEFCRCFTTAQQFMFGPTVEQSQDLTYFVYEEALRCAKSMRLLNEAPARGTNTGMVSHAGFSCPTLDSLAWGEAAIYKPQAPTSRACTTVGSCNTNEACVSGFCVQPLFIGRVPALGTNAWSSLP